MQYVHTVTLHMSFGPSVFVQPQQTMQLQSGCAPCLPGLPEFHPQHPLLSPLADGSSHRVWSPYAYVWEVSATHTHKLHVLSASPVQWQEGMSASSNEHVPGSTDGARGTNRMTKAHSFLPPPPLSSLLFCSGFFFSPSAPLFCCSVSETPRFVVCLPLTSVCLYRILPAPLSLPLLSSVLFCLLSPLLSPLCVQSLCLIFVFILL